MDTRDHDNQALKDLVAKNPDYEFGPDGLVRRKFETGTKNIFEDAQDYADEHKSLDFIVPTVITGNPVIGLAGWLGSLFRRKRK
jgi:hypothetical protein